MSQLSLFWISAPVPSSINLSIENRNFLLCFPFVFFFVRLDCSVAFMSSSADCHIQCLVDPDFNPSVASVYNSYRQFSRPGGSRFSFTIL